MKCHTLKTIWYLMMSSALVFVITACTPAKVVTQVTLPAKSSNAGKVQRIAVAPFDGESSEMLGAQVEAMLNNTIINDKPYYTVVDRAHLKRQLDEQNLSLSDVADPATAARIGKMVGVEGLLAGAVTQDINDSDYIEKRRECVAENNDGDCVRYVVRKYQCTKRTASLKFVPKLIDVETSKVVFSRTLRGKSVDKACPNLEPDAASALAAALTGKETVDQVLTGESELLDVAANQVVSQLRIWVAPSEATVQIALKKADDVVSDNTDLQETYESAYKFAEAGRMDRACELWKDSYEIARDSSVAVLYSMGVCAEVNGNYSKAMKYYGQADKALMEPDDKVNSALSRVKKRKNEEKRLSGQMKDR